MAQNRLEIAKVPGGGRVFHQRQLNVSSVEGWAEGNILPELNKIGVLPDLPHLQDPFLRNTCQSSLFSSCIPCK